MITNRMRWNSPIKIGCSLRCFIGPVFDKKNGPCVLGIRYQNFVEQWSWSFHLILIGFVENYRRRITPLWLKNNQKGTLYQNDLIQNAYEKSWEYKMFNNKKYTYNDHHNCGISHLWWNWGQYTGLNTTGFTPHVTRDSFLPVTYCIDGLKDRCTRHTWPTYRKLLR